MTDTAIQTTSPAPLGAMDMIQTAYQKAIDTGGAEALAVANSIIEQLTKQRDYEDRQRFNEALRRIQDEIKPIVKTGWNNETRTKYATSNAVDDAIEGLIRREGMTLSFRPEPSPHPDSIILIGVLSLGAYSREYPLDLPADGKGPKGGPMQTRTHATVSATTYGMRTIKKLIFNLRFTDKEDDDGNKAGGKAPGRMPETEQVDHLDNIKNAGNLEELQRLYFNALNAAEAIGDGTAIKAIINAKTNRFNELRSKGNR